MPHESWVWSIEHGQQCQIIETQSLWSEVVCRVWLPEQDTVVRVRADKLRPIGEAGATGGSSIAYAVAAARVADALTHDVLLAPIESSVIPLPHQIRALSRATSNERVRYLLADEVGLGKTIEAGLIMRELKLRGLVRRTLVIAPKGLVTQWVSEMRLHFNEDFQLVLPDDLQTLRRISVQGSQDQSSGFGTDTVLNREPSSSGSLSSNSWRMFSQVVVPMDSVKPLDRRRGWTATQVAEYNRERFEDLISAGWDLVIVDESHRLGGSTDQVARFKLGQGLAEAAPYLLLLSATPHQGKTEAFHRLVSLLDKDAFPDPASIAKERIQPYVIRTEKRRAIDAQGKPLFKPRQTRLLPVAWGKGHQEHRRLYEAVTEYVRDGYNQALKEKRSYIGFLMILMQRLVTSSTRAIRVTLEKRLDVLKAPDEQLTLFPMLPEEEWADLDGQEQVDTLLRTRLKAMKNERAEVKLLLEAAKRTEAAGPDAKAVALLDLIYRLQQEEGDPELKILIFTEFVPTQEMLREFLSERGFSVVCLNGSMGLDERGKVQEEFANKARILISTDAGGEGLNLQFCHVVVNYDIPWNPMRLEQRIGRVDRIGQVHVVRATNFVLEDTVEHRVREVLEEKLAVILREFGVDKAGDVLDSEQAEQIFDDLYMDAILHPETLEAKVESVVSRVQNQAKEARETASILGTTEVLDPSAAQQFMAHPLPHWVERMTVSYLEAHGGKADKRDGAWNLTWPNGEKQRNVVFTAHDAELKPSARYITLEDPRIRGLAMRLPRFAPGQPIPSLPLAGLPADVKGYWSLWRVSLHTVDWNRQRVMPLFLHDDGRLLQPTARHIWDQLLLQSIEIARYVAGAEAEQRFARIREAAEAQGKAIYGELVQAHRKRLMVEREKGEYAFAARRRMVERIGLPAVRGHRLAQLADEERAWRAQVEKRNEISPDLTCILLVRVGDVT